MVFWKEKWIPPRRFSICAIWVGVKGLVRRFNFGLILERATEIHVMESSIRCMLETLDTSKAKHYLYRFVNGPWKSVPYYIKEKNIFVGTSKKWIFKDLKFLETKKKPTTEEIINLLITSYKNFFRELDTYNFINFKTKAESMSVNNQ